MRVESYYQTTLERTIPLVFLTKKECDAGGSKLTPFERNSLVSQQFVGDLGQMGIIHDATGICCKVCIGAGEQATDADVLASVANRLPPGAYVVSQTLSLRALVVWSLAQYVFCRYKSNAVLPRLLWVDEAQLPTVLAEAAAVFLVRDLINTPANDMGPSALADVMATLAKTHQAEFEQCVGDELLVENFPAVHAVGRAGHDAPRLLSLRWGERHHPRVTLVGKGVCFDSGGLDIKNSSGMRFMKKDMGGAAQVLGLAQWLMTHRVPIRLHVLIPAVENAIDAKAYRPGDVLKMRNDTTVEIHNTDAEGRLVLADALVMACEEHPELIIDFATLTGAARVAVGTELSALFTNDDTLARALSDMGDEVGDPIWRLPLHAGYTDLFASNIADMANASDSPYAGAITAALFLQHFVSQGISWAHFDIMAWNLGNKPGRPEGGEAMAMRAVGHYLRKKYQ